MPIKQTLTDRLDFNPAVSRLSKSCTLAVVLFLSHNFIEEELNETFLNGFPLQWSFLLIEKQPMKALAPEEAPLEHSITLFRLNIGAIPEKLWDKNRCQSC